MANILPEVQPVVTSMPSKGYQMQTGGSARRSFIKNHNDTYFIHGVPGHTHNASAMISVTADYSRKRDILSTIGVAWADEEVELKADDFTDSKEPHNKQDRYDRAIERGIGHITMIPENTHHSIEEPVRSISEIRTIVSPKDQLDTLTYVSNEYGDGWVDPVSGTVSSFFNRDTAVEISVYSYEGVPQLETDATGNNTMNQPVYIANENVNTVRYAITGIGSYDAAGNYPWEGSLQFFWDEDSRRYESREVSVFFPAQEINTALVGQAVVIKTDENGAIVPGTAIDRQDFKVTFHQYYTSRAMDGYCVWSKLDDSSIVTAATAISGNDIIPKIRVSVQYAALKIFSEAFWFGPPAYRIPVGTSNAIPGPPRQQTSGFPGTYVDKDRNRQENMKPYFEQLDLATDFLSQTKAYREVGASRVEYIKEKEVPVKQVAGQAGYPDADASNSAALVPSVWRHYIRPFCYGEAKLPVEGTARRTNRHGFTSHLKYENSPGTQSDIFWMQTDVTENDGTSRYTSDGVIPYPYIQPAVTDGGGTSVAIAFGDAEYKSDRNINDLVCMYPEEELFDLRAAIDDPPNGFGALGEEFRKDFYGNFEMTAAWQDEDNELVAGVTQPNEGTIDLFKHPRGAAQAPWNIAGAGGSPAHRSFVFTRLYRTFAQFKKNPSGKLNVAIKDPDRAEFMDHHSSRVFACAVYAEYELVDPLKPLKLQTFPFRVLCMQNHITVNVETFHSNFIASIPHFTDKDMMHAGLVDTTGQGEPIGSTDWSLARMKIVQRNLTGTQAAGVGTYPFTESAHPKYDAYVHNAIGNLFEITAYDSSDATNLILKDIYWGNLPGVMLCFNNYGVDAANSQAPRAFYLSSYGGVTGLIRRDASAPNDQDLTNVTGAGANDPHIAVGTGIGFNRVNMQIPYANFVELSDDEKTEVPLTQANFDLYITQVPASPVGVRAAPKLAIFVPGERHVETFHSNNYNSFRRDSLLRGSVNRAVVKISQHLCAPVLNPDMRINCIAPLNHASRHLPPELRDFQLVMRDIDFSFLKTTSTPVLGDIVLSEFNGGIQTVAAQQSLLYLPNFIEFTTTVQTDLTFSVDCMTGKGVPGFMCVFCRDSDNMFKQPIIKRLSLQNRTTMKKSDSVFDTDVHELFHMTQRNVHPRSEYNSSAFNERQTILLTTEDIGIMGLKSQHYQRQKRVQIRVNGVCTNEGTVTVIFIYNNRGMFIRGRQQSVVSLQ